jgi:hypothetical protein
MNSINRKISMVLILAAVAWTISCDSDEQQVSPLKGQLIGFVKLYDEEGVEIFERSNVKVTANENRSTLTDQGGRFEFTNIEAGNYIFQYEKEGFGAYKQFNVQFAAGNKPGVISNIRLIELPGIEITQVDAQVTGDRTISISGEFEEVDSYTLVYYVNDSSNVSNIKFDYSSSSSFCCFPVTRFADQIYLHDDLFHYGQKVYVAIYAASKGNGNSAFSYYDYANRKYVNPAVKKLTNPIELILN